MHYNFRSFAIRFAKHIATSVQKFLELILIDHCSYAVLLIEKKDEEGQSQVLSAALEVSSSFCILYKGTFLYTLKLVHATNFYFVFTSVDG